MKFNPMRFSIRNALFAILILSGFVAYLAYYRTATQVVTYESVLVSGSNLGTLTTQLRPTKDSPYGYRVLNQTEFEQMRQVLQADATKLVAGQQSIHIWPRQAVSRTFSRPTFLPVDDPKQGPMPAKLPADVSGHFNGFFGIRREGGALRLRVEVYVSCRKPDESVRYVTLGEVKYDETAGDLFYEGPAPEHGILFAAPIDEQKYHVVLISTSDK